MENDAVPVVPVPPPEEAPPPPPPKRSRWRKIILFFAAALVAAVLLVAVAGPPVAASVGKSKIESILGEKLDSSVTVGRLSLGWGGRVDLGGFRIAPRGFPSPLLEVREVNVDVSVPSAIGGKYVARVEVVAPKIVVEKDASGRFNYDFPKPKEEPKKEAGGESPPAAKPFVQAELRVREGEIVVRDRGRETVFRNVTLEARVDTLEKPVEYSFSLENPTHGKLSVKGSFDLDRKSGPLLLELERISLKNLGAAAGAYSDVRDLDGTMDGRFEYQISGLAGFSGRGNLEVRDLALSMGGRSMKLDRLSLVHEGGLDEKGNGRHDLRVSSGKALEASLAAEVTDALAVPGAKVSFSADSDLAELNQLLQGLIGLKADMRLEGRVKARGRAETKGPDLKAAKAEIAAKADLEIEAADLSAVDKENKRYEIDRSLALKVAGSWDGKTSTGTLDALKLDSSFAAAEGRGGASVGKELEIRDTAITFRADLEKLAGKLRSFLEKPPALGGSAEVTARVSGERVEVEGALKGARFSGWGPVDAVLKHEGTLDKKGSGRHRFRLESGRALVVEGTAEAKDLAEESRALSGRVRAEGDLALLGDLLPGLLELKAGTGLAGFVSMEADFETRGSTFAKFDVSAAAKGLESVEKATGKRQEIEKSAAVSLRGSWDGARSALAVEEAKAVSSFATLEARGQVSLADRAVRDSSMAVRADLDRLGAKLAVFMPDPPGLAGSVSMDGTYAGDRYEVRGTVKGLKVSQKKDGRESVAGPIDASVVQKGVFENRPGGRFVIEESRITSNALDLAASGEIRKVMEESREGDLKADLAVRPAELSKWVPDLGMGGPEIRAEAFVTLRPKLVAASGKTRVDGLTMAAKDAAGVSFTRTAKTGPLEFSVEMREGDILARLRTALFEWVDKGYAAKGGFETEVSYNGTKGTSGTSKIVNLEIVDAQKNAVKDPAVTVVHDVGMSPGAYELRKMEVSSTFIRGGLTGRVMNLDKEPEFSNVRGSFRYVPDRLGAVLAPWMPGALEGAEEKALDFRLDGKAKASTLLAVLRAGEGSLDVDLAKYTHTGISVSGKTRLDLKEGRARSATPLQVNKGRTEMDVALDFREPESKPRSTLDFRAKEVDANADMGPLLEKIHPIFFTNKVGATVDGKVDSDFRLAWEGPVDPSEKDWIAASSRFLTGSGSFSAKNLSIVGSPTVEKLMEALGAGNRLEGELYAGDIRVGNGRCSYKDMTLRMKRYELRFSGWVGFDRRMELMVEMPMTEHIVKKYPNLQKYLGKTFFVPLEGTVNSPRFDFDRAIAELLKRAMEGVIQDKAKDLLEDLLKKKKKDK